MLLHKSHSYNFYLLFKGLISRIFYRLEAEASLQDLNNKLEASKIEITGLKAELTRVSGINSDLNSKYMNLKIGNFIEIK